MSESETPIKSSARPAWVMPAAAAAVIVLAGLGWWQMVSNVDRNSGPPRLDLSLDVTKGERLHKVFNGKGNQVAFVIAQGSDRKIWFEGRITEVVSSVTDIDFYQRAERREMIAKVKKGTNTHLLASSGETFVLSEPLLSVTSRTDLRGDKKHFAWIANDKEGGHALFFNGATFLLGETMTNMNSITATDDGQTVITEGIHDRANAYGYDVHVFGKPFYRLKKLGEKSFYIIGRKPSGVWHTVIDHKVSDPFKSIKQVKHGEETDRLVYLGQRDDGWRIYVESRVKDDAPQAEHGPFAWIGQKEGAATLYDYTGKLDQFHFIAGRGENQHVGLYKKGNGVGLSPAFKTVGYRTLKAGGLPLYEGRKEETIAILHGASAGPDFAEVEELKVIEKGGNFAYLGFADERVTIVHGGKAQGPVDKVAYLGMTKPSENLIAAVVDGESMKVYHQDKFSKPALAILGLKALKEDGLAWKIDDGEGERVVRNHARGPRFETIGKLNVSPGGKLWYDGNKDDRVHRVLIDQVGTPADRVTAPVFTPDEDQMIYGHMREATDDRDPDQFVERWKVVDEKGAGRAFIRTPSRSNPEMALRFIMGSKGTAYHYKTTVDAGIFVGSNRTVYGPFDTIKEPTVSNDGSLLSFFAEDTAGWHLHHKGKLAAAYDETQSLRFTIVGDHPRYAVRRGKQWATVIDDQLFHKINFELINHAKTAHRFAGHQDDGWHVVVNMKRSKAFDAVGQLQFGQDDHGVFGAVEKEGQNHLIHLPFGGEYILAAGYDRIWMPSPYPDPVRRGEYTVDEAKVTITPSGDAHKNSDDLAKLAPETKLYVAFDVPYVAGLRGQRHVVEHKDDIFTLNAGWSDEFLGWVAKKNGSIIVHTVTVPYSYQIRRDERMGYVYDNKVYTEILEHRYGDSRTLYMRAKDSMQRWIIDTTVHGGFDTIAIKHFEDLKNHRRYVLRVSEGDKSGYIIGDPSGFLTDFGRVDETTSVEWTPEDSQKPRTIKWSGRDEGNKFTAIGMIRYDGVEGLITTPKLKLLAYIAKRGGRYSVNIDGNEHPWYSKIPKPEDGERLTFKGDQDTPTYQAVNHYVEKADMSFLKGEQRTRSIHRLIVGDQQSEKFHDFKLLQSNDRLKDTQYLARSDDGWRHYRGKTALSNAYEDYDFLKRWEAPKPDEDEDKKKKKKKKKKKAQKKTKESKKDDQAEEEKKPEPFVVAEPKFHFIGRNEDGWVEVHHGVEGVRLRGFSATQPTIVRVNEKDLAKRFKLEDAKAENTKAPAIKYLPATGGYIYVAKKGANQVLVHDGRTMVEADKIEKIYSYKSGKVAAHLKRGDQFQAMYETSLGPLVESIETSWALDGDQFVAKLKIDKNRKMLWSNRGQTKTFKSTQDPSAVDGGKAWQAIVTGLDGIADGRNGDTLAKPSDRQALVQGGRVIAVADGLKELKKSDAGLVLQVKIKHKTERTTRQLVEIVTLLKAQKDRLNKEPLEALEEVLSVWEDYGFTKAEDGRLSDDLDTVSETNAEHAFKLLKKALDVDFEKIGDGSGGGRAMIDSLLDPVRKALKETTEDRYRVMVNGKVGPLFDKEIDAASVKVLGAGGLNRTLYIGKRGEKGEELYLASNEIRYGPHDEIVADKFGWAYGGTPYVVTGDGEQKTLLIGEEKIFEGTTVDRFVRFGERTLLGGNRSNTKVRFYDGQRVIEGLTQKSFKDQDPFLGALKLAHSYDLWSSNVRVTRATTLYSWKLEEDEETGDSTLHWIEGNLDLKSESMRVLQHQMPIPRVACKAMQPLETLFADDPPTIVPDRKEKALVGTLGVIDEKAKGRFVFTSDDGQHFNFDRGALDEENQGKEWRADREEWTGEKVEIEWTCSYHDSALKGIKRQLPRPKLTGMKLHEEEEEEEKSKADDDQKKQPAAKVKKD